MSFPSSNKEIMPALDGGEHRVGRSSPSPASSALHRCYEITNGSMPYSPLNLPHAFPVQAHTLCYEFIINPNPPPGQLWCKIQGLVDLKTFLCYDCVAAKAISTDVLGEKVKSTKTWQQQSEMLRDVCNRLKQDLLDLQLANCTSPENNWTLVCAKSPAAKLGVEEERGQINSSEEVDIGQGPRICPELRLFSFQGAAPLKLRAIMTCHQKASGHFSGFWEFGCNEQTLLRVDLNQRKWTEVPPGWRCMKEKWKNDKELFPFLYQTSMGDCGSFLKEFMEHWKESLETRD
ncbi:PREDICTED: NKG2D ligand 1-like [Chinchilla lanigera]|uniref:NKG2D ligand 1-like n=1 Tax=Chinchilla lanigera TaxID=34839 RepID=UPI0006974528|nr:PREDICTED: NKG2D ligand 1-like [Chinchilla lanigera]